MTEKADLLDQLQQYEYINIQLESETETIGMVKKKIALVQLTVLLL